MSKIHSASLLRGNLLPLLYVMDQYQKEVVKRGLEAREPQDMPWGWRQFYVQDTDGHKCSFRNPTTAGIA